MTNASAGAGAAAVQRRRRRSNNKNNNSDNHPNNASRAACDDVNGDNDTDHNVRRHTLRGDVKDPTTTTTRNSSRSSSSSSSSSKPNETATSVKKKDNTSMSQQEYQHQSRQRSPPKRQRPRQRQRQRPRQRQQQQLQKFRGKGRQVAVTIATVLLVVIASMGWSLVRQRQGEQDATRKGRQAIVMMNVEHPPIFLSSMLMPAHHFVQKEQGPPFRVGCIPSLISNLMTSLEQCSALYTPDEKLLDAITMKQQDQAPQCQQGANNNDDDDHDADGVDDSSSSCSAQSASSRQSTRSTNLQSTLTTQASNSYHYDPTYVWHRPIVPSLQRRHVHSAQHAGVFRLQHALVMRGNPVLWECGSNRDGTDHHGLPPNSKQQQQQQQQPPSHAEAVPQHADNDDDSNHDTANLNGIIFVPRSCGPVPPKKITLLEPWLIQLLQDEFWSNTTLTHELWTSSSWSSTTKNHDETKDTTATTTTKTTTTIRPNGQQLEHIINTTHFHIHLIRGSAVLLHQYLSSAYSHGLTETVPRLMSLLEYLRAHPQIPILAEGRYIQKRAHDWNRLLRLDNPWIPYLGGPLRTRPGTRNDLYLIQQVLVPHGSACETADPVAIQLLQATLAETLAASDTSQHGAELSSKNPNLDNGATPLTILLQKRHRRQILNHDELKTALQDLCGQETQDMVPPCVVQEFFGNETLYETARLHHFANLVIGPHGAGLAHVMFVKRPKQPFKEGQNNFSKPVDQRPLYYLDTSHPPFDHAYLFESEDEETGDKNIGGNEYPSNKVVGPNPEHFTAALVELHPTRGNMNAQGRLDGSGPLPNICHQVTAQAAGMYTTMLVQDDDSEFDDFRVNVDKAVNTVADSLRMIYKNIHGEDYKRRPK